MSAPLRRAEPRLYGHAAAIRALYQNMPAPSERPKKPKKPKGGRTISLFAAFRPLLLRPAFATR